MCNTVKGKKEAVSGFLKRFWKITGRMLRTAAATEISIQAFSFKKNKRSVFTPACATSEMYSGKSQVGSVKPQLAEASQAPTEPSADVSIFARNPLLLSRVPRNASTSEG